MVWRKNFVSIKNYTYSTTERNVVSTNQNTIENYSYHWSYTIKYWIAEKVLECPKIYYKNARRKNSEPSAIFTVVICVGEREVTTYERGLERE